MIEKKIINIIMAFLFAFLASLSSVAMDVDILDPDEEIQAALVLAAWRREFHPNIEIPKIRRVPFCQSTLSGRPGFFMADAEIIAIESAKPGAALSTNSFAKVLAHGQYLIGQNGLSTSSAAVINMILLDHGIMPDNMLLTRKQAMSVQEMSAILAGNKLSSMGFANPSESLLINAPMGWLKIHSALLYLENSEIGPHWVILDYADDSGNVLLRDPFHNWCIKVSLDTLIKRAPKFAIVIKK